jgi:hypothetical protein
MVSLIAGSVPSAHVERSTLMRDCPSGPTLSSEAVEAPCIPPSGHPDGGVRNRHHHCRGVRCRRKLGCGRGSGVHRFLPWDHGAHPPPQDSERGQQRRSTFGGDALRLVPSSPGALGLTSEGIPDHRERGGYQVSLNGTSGMPLALRCPRGMRRVPERVGGPPRSRSVRTFWELDRHTSIRRRPQLGCSGIRRSAFACGQPRDRCGQAQIRHSVVMLGEPRNGVLWLATVLAAAALVSSCGRSGQP